MSAVTHLAALERRHETLEHQIDREMQHASRDVLKINSLKRKKLEIKDEIARLQRDNTQH
ncbi:YdcH family protein [Cucumibacter marinus]|jgi:hypothetical protein|uniref:YdcH family protein n=1 Tax=Cucumibacter marinus TaxID=1121252 RepID=UPI00048EFA02|nr:DUF465 domain-containing protein [Cucumibacter marinus]